MSFPLGSLKQFSDTCRYLWGGRDVQSFLPIVLIEHPTKVPVIAHNFTV